LIEDLNSSNKKLNNLNYELDLLKNDIHQTQTDNKHLLKQCEDQSMLISNISIAKEKEISEIKNILTESVSDLNNKLLNKDNILKETLVDFEN